MRARHTPDLQRLCTAAMLLAIGVLLPQVFHLFGGTEMGGRFLPMHIPVLLAGLLLGPVYGGVVGAAAPLVSCLLTAMPPLAKLPLMLCELIVYGVLSGLFVRLLHPKRFGIYVSLIAAMVGGRLVYAAGLFVAGALLGLNVPPAVSVWAALITGLPGIAIQLVFIPAIVFLLMKVMKFEQRSRARS